MSETSEALPRIEIYRLDEDRHLELHFVQEEGEGGRGIMEMTKEEAIALAQMILRAVERLPK